MTAADRDDPRIADLPASIRPVAEHLGYGVAARLIELFPGYRLRIPRTLRDDHPLRAIGEAAGALASNFAGEIIDIPTQALSTAARERRIMEMAAAQPRPSLNEIAGAVGLSRRHVQRVLGRGPQAARLVRKRGPDPRQLDLVAWLGEG